MNELEKCMAGEWYNCHDEIFLEYKNNARNLLSKYNSFSYKQKEEKAEVLKQLLGSMGTIGAGSVVTKDIPANCVAVGNPCRVIRKINGEC